MLKEKKIFKVRKITVIYKKLGRERAYGVAYSDEKHIYIDERLKGKKHLEILLHESLHVLFPEANEDEIIKKSIVLTNTVCGQHYRRIDNTNDTPLQDGKK